jgi:hypothetical protein
MNDHHNRRVAFLPFHALNDFMVSDYRLNVIRTTLSALPNLPKNLRTVVDKQTRRHVRVPGFRNSVKAPPSVKVRPMAKAFEKHPHLVAAVLIAWAEAKNELRQQVFDLLTTRNWEILPLDADRTKLPGFLPKWPSGEDFETLNQSYKEMFPSIDATENDVSLMAVWLSGRLPLEMEDSEKEDVANEAEVDAETPS